jgi:hypothetical protein
MAKFMILYSSTASAKELMARATPEQMKASMDEWIAWKNKVPAVAKFDFGMPLQAVSQVTASGVTDSTSQVGGYSTMEADSKEVVIDVLKDHPHLKREGASIDVLEVLAMPGM